MNIGIGLGLGSSCGRGAPPITPSSIFGASLLFDFLWSNNTNVGGLVTSLTDRSSNAYSITATGANRPTRNASGGGNNQGSIGVTAGTGLRGTIVAPALPFTVLVIARSLTISGVQQYLYDFGSNSNATFQQTTGYTFQQYSGILGATSAFTGNADFLLESYFAGSASSGLEVNGAALTTATCGATVGTTSLTLGNAGGANFPNFPWRGNVYEWVCVSGAISSGQRANMRAYSHALVGSP